MKKYNNDILKDWFIFRENKINETDAKDNNYNICFDEIYRKILNSTKRKNRGYIENQLRKIDDKLIDYTVYMEEKNYRNGFCDGIKLILEVLYNK